MVGIDKKILKEEPPVTKKTWKFSKGDTGLEFTLRVDIKQQLKDFKELCETAIETIDEELKTVNNE